MYRPDKLAPTPAAARPLTPDLAGLTDWLSRQDGATEYDWRSGGDCLLCRFASAVSGRDRLNFLEAMDILGGELLTFRCTMLYEAAYGWPHTYEAALERARALTAPC